MRDDACRKLSEPPDDHFCLTLTLSDTWLCFCDSFCLVLTFSLHTHRHTHLHVQTCMHVHIHIRGNTQTGIYTQYTHVPTYTQGTQTEKHRHIVSNP